MKYPIRILALATVTTLTLTGCEATVNSNDMSIPPAQPSRIGGSTAVLCSWARDAGLAFDGGRTEIDQTVYTSYSDRDNHAAGRLKIFLDCDSGDSQLSWDLDANRDDSWDNAHLVHRMDFAIGEGDGPFTFSGKTVDYKNLSHYYCTETQAGSGVSRLEEVERDARDLDLLHLTVHVAGTLSEETRCDCQGMNCDARSETHSFDTAYHIDLHRQADHFSCESAQYDYHADPVDRVCRGHYN